MSVDRPTLYGPELLAHARSPRHAGRLEAPTRTARVDNPLCGDRVTVQLRLENGRVAAIAHQTRGCALCIASASVMAEAVWGEPMDGIEQRARAVVEGLTPAADASLRVDDPALALFAGLSAAPGRHGCVSLPWQALLSSTPAQ